MLPPPEKFLALELEHQEWSFKILKSINKKYQSKGQAIHAMHRRTANTGLDIVSRLMKSDVQFEDMTLALYLSTKDNMFQMFTRKYEAELELSLIDKDKFIKSLHPFFMEMRKFIFDNDYYLPYLEFLALFQEQSVRLSDNPKHDTVACCYLNLLLQQLEYLRQNVYDINKMVIGRTEDNKPLVTKDIFYGTDIAQQRIEMSGKLINGMVCLTPNVIRKEFEKFGFYGIRTELDLMELLNIERIYYTNIQMMAFLITPAMECMLPKEPFVPRIMLELWPRIVKPIHEIARDQMRTRKRLLPADGLKIEFPGSKMFRRLMLREVLQGDRIVALWRLETITQGDLSGYIDTKTGWLCSPFSSARSEDKMNQSMTEQLQAIVESVVLWAYIAATCNHPDILPTTESYAQYFRDNSSVTVTVIQQNARSRGNAVTGTTHRTTDKYSTEDRNIAGYIRRLPSGHKASERAVTIAESLGLSLEANETYVQPFIRQAWVLKDKLPTEEREAAKVKDELYDIQL